MSRNVSDRASIQPAFVAQLSSCATAMLPVTQWVAVDDPRPNFAARHLKMVRANRSSRAAVIQNPLT
jgi:hypothetical protein